MDKRLLPKTPVGRLLHVMEESSEVIKAICKLSRFGPVAFDDDTKITYDNVSMLSDELEDLRMAITRVQNDIKLGLLADPSNSSNILLHKLLSDISTL